MASPEYLKIALDVRVLQGEDARKGMGHYTRGLVEALLKRSSKDQIHYYLLTDKEGPRPFLRLNGSVEMVPLPSPGEPPRLLEFLFDHLPLPLTWRWLLSPDLAELRRWVRREKPAILHFFSPLHGPGLWLPCPPALNVATVYDLIPFLDAEHYLHCWPAAARERYNERLRQLSQLNFVFPISQTVKEDLKANQKVGIEKMEVAYPGLRFGRIIQDKEEEAAYGDRQQRILALVSQNPSKNSACLLEAYGGFTPEEREAWPLHLVGPDSPECMAWIEEMREASGIETENCVYHRGLGDDALSQMFMDAQLFVIPSRAEGFGLPALEAMAYGAPVVAATIPVLQEIMEDCGYFFDPAQPDELREVLRKAIADEEDRADLSEKGKSRAQQFDWNRTALKVVRNYHHLLLQMGEKSRPPE